MERLLQAASVGRGKQGPPAPGNIAPWPKSPLGPDSERGISRGGRGGAGPTLLDPISLQLPTAPRLPRPSQRTICLTPRPLLPQAPAQEPQRPLRPVPGSPSHRQCWLRPGLGKAGTSWPAVAARRVRTAQGPPGQPGRGPGTLPQLSKPGLGCLATPLTGRRRQRELAGQPTRRPCEAWAVPRAAARGPSGLGIQARPPHPTRLSFLRRSAWLGTGWKMTCC